MNPGRLRIGEWLTGVGGLVLFASTFLHWYDVDSDGTRTAHGIVVAWGSLSAWEAFSVVDLLMVLLAGLAIGVAVMAAVHNTPAASLALASLTALLGLIVSVVVLVRAASPPAFAIEGVEIPDDDVSTAAGLWIGVGACLLTTISAFVAMRDERFPRAARIEVPVETIPPPQGGEA